MSVGYEGRELDSFIGDLLARGVAVLADVRLNAVSRKRGFSKSALKQALENNGIRYVHLRGLGNPPDNRAAFAGGDEDVRAGRGRFRELLSGDGPQRDLRTLKDLSSESVVAVLCVERNEQRCHRKVVIEALYSVA